MIAATLALTGAILLAPAAAPSFADESRSLAVLEDVVGGVANRSCSMNSATLSCYDGFQETNGCQMPNTGQNPNGPSPGQIATGSTPCTSVTTTCASNATDCGPGGDVGSVNLCYFLCYGRTTARTSLPHAARSCWGRARSVSTPRAAVSHRRVPLAQAAPCLAISGPACSATAQFARLRDSQP